LADAKKGMLNWQGGDQTWRNQFMGQDYGSEKAATYFTSTNAAAQQKIDAAQRALKDYQQTGVIPGDNPNRGTMTQTLSPEQQAIYDQQTKNQQLLGGLGQQGIESAQGVIGKAVDYGGVPGMPGSSDAIRNQTYDAMMQRPNEDLTVQRDNANSTLTASGIPKDSLAYQNAMRQIDRQENDARNQAVIAGGVEAQRNYGMDLGRRQQGLTEYNAQRSIPLNEITALMSGSQVSNPFQMPGYAQNGQVAPAPTYAATNAAGQYGTDIYNANAARQGNTQNGLIGLGGSAMMAAAMMF